MPLSAPVTVELFVACLCPSAQSILIGKAPANGIGRPISIEARVEDPEEYQRLRDTVKHGDQLRVTLVYGRHPSGIWNEITEWERVAP